VKPGDDKGVIRGAAEKRDEAPQKKMEASGFLSPGAPNLTLRLLEFRAVE
jgi:hypothetical protein